VYLRRVRIACRSFAAVLAHVSAVVTPPAPAEKSTRNGPPAALPGAGV
jgi:hypothetical protein